MAYEPTPLPTPDPADLHRWIRESLKLNIPTRPVCPHHQAPFDYIHAAYTDAADLVVWAPRGGGKTTLGALATLLDLLFKPSCHVRILGGSLDQSGRMWEQLVPMLEAVAPGRASMAKSRPAKSASRTAPPSRFWPSRSAPCEATECRNSAAMKSSYSIRTSGRPPSWSLALAPPRKRSA